MSDDPEDTELFERLRAHDPAASLPPAEPAQVARLLEDAMSHDLDTPARRRTPLTWLVAAAALLVIAGVGVFAVVGGDDEPQVPTAQDPAPTVVELSARPPVAAKCAVPTAELLSQPGDRLRRHRLRHRRRHGHPRRHRVVPRRSGRPGHRRRAARGHAGAGAGGRLPGPASATSSRRTTASSRCAASPRRTPTTWPPSTRRRSARLAWPGDRRRAPPRRRRRHPDGTAQGPRRR